MRNNKTDIFPYTCLYNGGKKIFLWQSNEKGGDTFRLDANKELVSGTNIDELKRVVKREGISVHWEEQAGIDIDKFLKVLNNLRGEGCCSTKACAELLEGWNFLEDLARTFELDEELTRLHMPSLKKIYDKLFYGNNLPSVTPKGKIYIPLWTTEEVSLLRREILLLWKVLELKLAN